MTPGQVIEASYINNLQSELNASKTELTNLKNVLRGKTILKETILWTGNYIPYGYQPHVLWDSSQHQTWDYMEFHISHDTNALPEIVKVSLGPSYVYNSSSNLQSFLYTTHHLTYRRIMIRTNGISLFNGDHSGFFLRKIVGVKTIVIP